MPKLLVEVCGQLVVSCLILTSDLAVALTCPFLPPYAPNVSILLVWFVNHNYQRSAHILARDPQRALSLSHSRNLYTVQLQVYCTTLRQTGA